MNHWYHSGVLQYLVSPWTTVLAFGYGAQCGNKRIGSDSMVDSFQCRAFYLEHGSGQTPVARNIFVRTRFYFVSRSL